MNWKLIFCVSLCGIAALCPAPIRDTSAKPHSLPIMTPEQQAAGQKYDGTMGVVGSVPVKTNPDGTGPLIQNSAKGAEALRKVSPEIEAKAISNLERADQRLVQDGRTGPNPVLILLIVIAAVGGMLYAAKTYLEKFGPAPTRYRSEERLKKSSQS